MKSENSLFCFGLGFTALALAQSCLADGWRVTGTYRNEDEKKSIEAAGIAAIAFDQVRKEQLDTASHLLSSVPPSADGDPVLRKFGDWLTMLNNPEWFGYLSTTGVYGDTGGATVDETASLNPSNDRSKWRVEADQAQGEES